MFQKHMIISNLEIFMDRKKYSFLKGLTKAVVSLIVFAIPLLIAQFPDWANLSIGTVGVLLVNFLKTKYF